MNKIGLLIGVMKKKLQKSVEMKNFSWLVSGKIIQMAISLVVSLLTARYLGPGNYGLINYSTTYITFFSAICTLGISAILVKNFTDKPGEVGITIGTTLCIRLLSSLISALLIILTVSIVDKGEQLTILVSSVVCVSLVFQPFETFNYWFQYKYKAKIIALVSLIAYISVASYRIILLVQNRDVVWFAFAFALDYAVVAILLLFYFKKNGGPKLKASMKKAKELLKSSYHFILSSLMIAIYGYTDKFMLKQMLDESSVGYYSIATSICTMWVFVLQAVVDAMYPTIMKLHKENYDAYKRKNRQLYAIVFYIAIGMSLVVTVLAPLGIHILYGDAYLPSINPLRIVTWYTAFSYLGVARNAWLVCEGKQKYLKYMYFLAAAINVCLNLCLIPIGGPSGAALASLVTQVFTSLILPSFFKETRENVRLMLESIFLKGLK